MKNYVLFEGKARKQLLPLTYTRPVADVRVGILTIRQKWEHYLKQTTSTITEAYLSNKWPLKSGEDNVGINGAVLPNAQLLQEIEQLQLNEVLMVEDVVVAIRVEEDINQWIWLKGESGDGYKIVMSQSNPIIIEHPSDIFTNNGAAIEQDFELLTNGRTSASIHESNTLIGDRIFVEEGAKVTASILNSESGPIYIGKNAEVMEGSIVRGPFALCEHGVLKMGTKIYGPTTIGIHSKVGGEVNNSVIFGYSNKAHDGFLGNSVIGEWCNLGADANTSNLKNNYGEVKVWSYEDEANRGTGLQFHGLIMGDHSKCGINTMFNTGTITGVSANIFGGDFPPKFIPSFSWGGANGFDTFNLEKAFELAETVTKRRNITFTDDDRDILRHIYTETKKFRS
jgi:UDP-N-acetylglucosamine diphosphorylase/glucosamine-1-phosphate N-acetyltransferase